MGSKLHLLLPSTGERAVIFVLVPEFSFTWLTENYKNTEFAGFMSGYTMYDKAGLRNWN